MTTHPTDGQRAKEYARKSPWTSETQVAEEMAFLAGAASVRREAEELVSGFFKAYWEERDVDRSFIDRAEAFLGEKK